jgi:hypothetical protein
MDMTPSASAAAILPRVHAALMRGEPQAIWKISDRHTRSLWAALAHVDSETCPPLPWEELTDGQRVRLGTAPAVIINFLRNLSELIAED